MDFDDSLVVQFHHDNLNGIRRLGTGFGQRLIKRGK